MMKIQLFISILILCSTIGMSRLFVGPKRCAVAEFRNGSVHGVFHFNQYNKKSKIHFIGELHSDQLNGTTHGFGLHTFGDTSINCTLVGPYFNPFRKTHAGLFSKHRQVGDLGNLVFDHTGLAKIDVHLPNEDTLFGDNSLIGRSLVLHKNIDDLGHGQNASSRIDGNSGPAIDCAFIAITACA